MNHNALLFPLIAALTLTTNSSIAQKTNAGSTELLVECGATVDVVNERLAGAKTFAIRAKQPAYLYRKLYPQQG